MKLYANFSEQGECMYVGSAVGMMELPSSFTNVFPKRYKLVDGVITDLYPGESDTEAETLWHAELDAKREAAAAALAAQTK